MYSYEEDDMVEDPNLAKHLAHFGINLAQMEKVGEFYIGISIHILNMSLNRLAQIRIW